MQIAFWSGMVKSLVSIGLKIITMGRAVRASYKPRFSANLSNRRSENLGLTKFRLKNKGWCFFAQTSVWQLSLKRRSEKSEFSNPAFPIFLFGTSRQVPRTLSGVVFAALEQGEGWSTNPVPPRYVWKIVFGLKIQKILSETAFFQAWRFLATYFYVPDWCSGPGCSL